MTTHRFTREELYRRVWSQPMCRLAVELGISDVGLAKLCRRHQIPVPGRGYWERKAAGHPVEQVSLPPLTVAREISFVCRERSVKASPSPPEALHPAIAFERNPRNRVIVSKTLTHVHPLLQSTRREWARREQNDWRSPSPPEPALDLHVSRHSEDRACRIMQSLITALEGRGYKIRIKNYHTVVEAFGEEIGFDMSERGAKPRESMTSSQRQAILRQWRGVTGGPVLLPTGELRLRIGSGDHYEYTDKKGRKLEDCLNRFIEEVIGHSLYRRRAEQERREAASAERGPAEARPSDANWMANWEAWMSAWKRAQDIRAFAAAVREPFAPIQPGGKTEQWLSWAAAHADSIDPLLVLRRTRA